MSRNTGALASESLTYGESHQASFLARVWNFIRESRQRAAEREIALFIQRRGGKMTDDLEREISRTFGRTVGE